MNKASVPGNTRTISGTNNAAVYHQEKEGVVVHLSARNNFIVSSFDASYKIFAVGYDVERQEISIQ
ncbi:hypothetical protein CW731_00435 [Polaribacter sp. ALD11]|uniref:hypothetical protein n=1 Tax=Polaribacter sp. ALD11 TaxID=2058137 RepID=UPI000C310BD3|nr:hypothetical protein [Polaribacter sp. ALD11]AUC83845.1 hypothetical protein CW731_00435 [Polaribacter sp. ALD11]